MICRSLYPLSHHGHCIYGVRPPREPNIFLRGLSHHQLILRGALYRSRPCQSYLRGRLSGPSHIKSILHSPFPPPLPPSRSCPHPYYLLTQKRILKPIRTKAKPNPIRTNLLYERPRRLNTITSRLIRPKNHKSTTSRR